MSVNPALHPITTPITPDSRPSRFGNFDGNHYIGVLFSFISTEIWYAGLFIIVVFIELCDVEKSCCYRNDIALTAAHQREPVM